MNAFAHTIAHEDNLALASEQEEQAAIIASIEDSPQETIRGRYAYGMGLPLSPFWSARKRAGWYLARDEHDETADEEAAS